MLTLQVIKEVEQKEEKKAQYEIPLVKRQTGVNLYSALDKSIVVWAPAQRNANAYIMQARSSSNAVEWFTFLRGILGWDRAVNLPVNVPDLHVGLSLRQPFERLEASQNQIHEAANDVEQNAVIGSMMSEEQAIASNIVSDCMNLLKDSADWGNVVDAWSKDGRVGLAWKRYDRLEWVHGANERKMYGTLAMLKSHELELRPKSHYPVTAVTRKKRETLVEPTPVEGFLIRLTSQRGRVGRLGSMTHKQLYFHTHDRLLVFSRPTKADPPSPPRMALATDGGIPTTRAIAEEAPATWLVEPYPLKDDRVRWLVAGEATPEARKRLDGEAKDEADRKTRNMLDCEGYIDLCEVLKVRKARKGAMSCDDDVDSGSDVDFDAEVDDTPRADGTTRELDIDRTLELVMKSGHVIRLQAADQARRDEWQKHLRALSKYWKTRVRNDVALYKSTRERNLAELRIDEQEEAYAGQFAEKWQVRNSYASPDLYHMCGMTACRTVHIAGMLYRKPRVHSTFTRCNMVLCAGSLLWFRDARRTHTGKALPHLDHKRLGRLDLKGCYIYSGLVTQADLLYQNRTFDANNPGHHALPRVYLGGAGWTSSDDDVMTTFVLWVNTTRAWFRSSTGADADAAGGGVLSKTGRRANASTRRRLRRVAKLGSKGRCIVFRARSRAERDHWVLALQCEIERANGDRDAAEGEDWRLKE